LYQVEDEQIRLFFDSVEQRLSWLWVLSQHRFIVWFSTPIAEFWYRIG
jgi:hypothetical protein